MRKNYLNILVLILVYSILIGLNVGAQTEGYYGGTLRLGVSDSPPNLDWQSSTISSVRHAARYIWEGFVVFNANDEITPMLAKSWEVSDDGLTWTFYLREGILFHNGKEMTAEDAAASARRWVEVCPFRSVLGDVKSVEIVNKYTVEFKLEEKIGALAALMAGNSGQCIIMPKEICEGVPMGKLDKYIGTGPYKFSDWKLDQSIRLEKYLDYQPIDLEPSGYSGRKNAYFDEIIINFVPESSTLLAGLESGEFDAIEPIEPKEVERLEKVDEIIVQRFPRWAIHVRLNTKGAFEDQRLRQAVNIALDMEEIMMLIGKDKENIELNPSRFRENSIWYTGQLEKCYNLKDIEGAKKLMEEAGYHGEEILLMTTKHYDWAFDCAIALEAQLSAIGFNVKMEVIDWPTLVSRRGQIEGWDLYTSAGQHNEDPSKLTQNFMGDADGWYKDLEIIEQMQIITQEEDFKTRFDAWAKIENRLCENPHAISPGWLFEFRGHRSNIKGIPTTTNEAVYWNAYKE